MFVRLKDLQSQGPARGAAETAGRGDGRLRRALNFGWGVSSKPARENDPHKSHPGATFPRRPAGNRRNRRSGGLRPLLPEMVRWRPQTPFPGERGVPGARELMTVACCAEKNQLGIVEASTLSSRSWPCRIGSAGPVTARPTPALTATHAPRPSWPRPSTRPSVAAAKSPADRRSVHRAASTQQRLFQ